MSERKHVVIAGGGVAALEAALALQLLAAEYVDVELVAPEPRFWYRPLAVAEPFGLGRVPSFDLAELARRAGALFTVDAITHVYANARFAGTKAGANLPYDALLLACGVRPRPAIPGALTFRGPADTELVANVVAKIDAGEVTRVVVAVPLGVAWSLPAYELALMLSAHAHAARRQVDIALVTPEDEPLLLFGGEARDAIRRLFEERSIAVHTGFFATEFRDRELTLLPSKSLEADCVVALPTLRGPRINGVPQTRDGFVVVDAHGRVDGLRDVYAAGDLTSFPVKQGGLAAQQADAAAEAIAAAAGADVDPRPFRPVLRGLLLTGETPRFLRRDVGSAGAGTASVEPLWWPPTKLVGRYLAPFLADVAGTSHPQPPSRRAAIEIERELRPDDIGPRRIDDLDPDDMGTVAEVISTELLVVAPEETLGEVAEKMSAIDFASALVADCGRLIGILTSRDLLRAFAGRVHSSEARVREWMTAEPVAVRPDTSLASALRLMHDHAIHHLPVVEGEHPVGVVGMRAVARALASRQASAVGLGL